MSPLVIGVGQPDRGDDAVGLLVADEVRRTGPRCEVVSVSSPTRLVDLWEGRDLVVVVDAVRAGGPAGEVTVLDIGPDPLPARSGAGGSHGFGVAEAVELARSLDRLPRRLVVVGVGAESFTAGAGLSPAVAGAVDAATQEVLGALAPSSNVGGAD